MQWIKSYIKHFTPYGLYAVFSFAILTPAATAMPVNIEDEISALNISESEFETELGIEMLYVRLETVAHRVCDSGLYQAFQPEHSAESSCVSDMTTAFVNIIGHERLLAYHERQNEGTFL